MKQKHFDRLRLLRGEYTAFYETEAVREVYYGKKQTRKFFARDG